MPMLILQFKETTQGEYSLSPGNALTVGRREGNDIVIDNLAVSGSHARVECREDGCLLTDLESKNGTFVNGSRITTRLLQPGDEITIGKHTLVFSAGEAKKQAGAPGMAEKTMVLDTGEYRAMLEKNAPDAPQQTGLVCFVSGGSGQVELTKKLSKIGKDPSSEIVIGGFLMAKTAATISKRPSGYYINFVGGLYKLKVNGRVVKDSVLLKEFDRIEIGSARLEFVVKE